MAGLRLPFFLGTRVARRVLGLFVIGALVPLSALAVVSWFAVTGELERQTEENLRQLARNSGQSILQRLNLVENGLSNLDPSLPGAAGRASSLLATVPSVRAIGVEREGEYRLLGGTAAPSTMIPAAYLPAIERSGNVVIPGTTASELVLVAMESPEAGSARIWATVAADSMWAPAEVFAALPWVSSFCVITGRQGGDYCSDGRTEAPDAYRAQGGGHLDTFRYTGEAGEQTVGYWSFSPAGAFDTPSWTVLVSASASSIYAPLRGFSLWFVPVLVLGFGVVLLLSNIQVRRIMQPLADLESGTARISSGDFSTRVPIASDDEFGTLAASFNEMGSRIGDQLARLEAGRAIDRAVLGGFDAGHVVDAVVTQVPTLVPASSVGVLLEATDPAAPARMQWRLGDAGLGGTDVVLSAEDRGRLSDNAHHLLLADDGNAIVTAARRGLGRGAIVMFPFVVKDRLIGALLIELPSGTELTDPEVRSARQLANQAAIAFDDARLVQELEDMSWGALLALARAIDAKSRWTAGHSERVTEMALALGREMGLSDSELELLHRGGLLHDVGKIGVPAHVLDKSGPLSEEDFAHIRRHPEVGGRILEPIRAFAPALPIVVQHHERWDGAGYPMGLAGTEIDRLARVLAVADTFDAMASARPYRGGIELIGVTEEIVRCAGTQFDPEVVEAFERLMAGRTEWTPQRKELTHG